MSLFDRFKSITQNSQNPQKSESEELRSSFEDFENIEHEESSCKNTQDENLNLPHRHKKQNAFSITKVVTQNSQNPQKPENEEQKNSFEGFENIEYAIPTYKRVGRYESEEHLRQELKKYPRIVPCPKDDWHWQDKERCYQVCKRGVPKECIYHRVAYYRIRT